jgi:Uma2 family endonuclease
VSPMLHRREHRRFTIDEYLLLEENAATKSEYCDGEIFSMSGGTIEHNRIVRNLSRSLDAGLEGSGCETFSSDLRLYVESQRLFTYPDVFVLCGKPRMHGQRRDTVIDATLIIEVLSPSTEDYDRNGKFRIYRELPSFCEYLLVAQDEIRIEQHRRQGPGQWLMTEHTSLEGELAFSSIDVTLSPRAIYRDVFNSDEEAKIG